MQSSIIYATPFFTSHQLTRDRVLEVNSWALSVASTLTWTVMSYYPPSGSSYPYSAYHPPQANAYHQQHVQSAGGYPTTAYQQAYPATTVQGYGATWPYYSYYPPQQQQAQTAARSTPRPAATPSNTQATQAAAGTSTATASTTPAQHATTQPAPTTSVIAPSGQQRSYPTTYTYMSSYRDSMASSRGKKSSYRGLFTKERGSYSVDEQGHEN